MEVDSLRYGMEKTSDFGDTVEWRHWSVRIIESGHSETTTDSMI